MGIPVFIWLILLPLLASPLVYLAGRLFRQPGVWRVPNWIALLALAVTWESPLVPVTAPIVPLKGASD